MMTEQVCPWWTVPALLAVASLVLVWGSRFVPAGTDATGNADALLAGGVVCGFFGVRALWREAPGVES